MALTKLSKELKKLRVDAEINRAQMAKAIGITEKRLADIELGRLEITRKELNLIADLYAADESNLINATIASTDSITFDLTTLSTVQRCHVFALRHQLEQENAAAIEAAELEAKALKEAKRAERLAKKSQASDDAELTPAEEAFEKSIDKAMALKTLDNGNIAAVGDFNEDLAA